MAFNYLVDQQVMLFPFFPEHLGDFELEMRYSTSTLSIYSKYRERDVYLCRGESFCFCVDCPFENTMLSGETGSQGDTVNSAGWFEVLG